MLHTTTSCGCAVYTYAVYLYHNTNKRGLKMGTCYYCSCRTDNKHGNIYVCLDCVLAEVEIEANPPRCNACGDSEDLNYVNNSDSLYCNSCLEQGFNNEN